MPNKLTDLEIVKAFEDCDLEKATLYLYNTKEEKVVFIPTIEIYNLINHLQAENERLKEDKENLAISFANAVGQKMTAKSEAYKEFAERLKEEFMEGDNELHFEWLVRYRINNLLKELVGDK